MMKTKHWLGFSLMLIALSVWAKDSDTQTPVLKVVSTTNIVHDLVSQIGGDKIEAQALMDAGVDPHYYKATFSDMRKLSHADIVFYNGLQLEGRIQSVLQNLAAMKPVMAIADSINPAKLMQENDSYDPHIWFNVLLWSETILPIAHKLAELAPAHREYFLQRADHYTKQLKELDEWIRLQMQSIPEQRRVLITAHDAFGYFGAGYGVEVMALQGMNTTTELGLQDIHALKQVIKQRQIKAVFIESSVPKRSIESLIAGINAEGGSLKLGGELFSDALGAKGSAGGSYIGMMRHNTQTIVKALK